jgi:hypothetical protein
LSGKGISVKKRAGSTNQPNYLANELLEATGINGGNYFNYLSALKKELPVITSRFFKERDEFTEEPTQETKDLIYNYSVAQYYMLMEREAVIP